MAVGVIIDQPLAQPQHTIIAQIAVQPRRQRPGRFRRR
jgi:hypothetical protein